jgi:hypothetical protein
LNALSRSLHEPGQNRSLIPAVRRHITTDRLLLLAAISLMCVGAIFRLAEYFFNRSLWLDESFLALNILDHSIADLSHTLDFAQGAPLGFLITVKLFVLGFGKSELVLRLLPLVCGLASLPLFYFVACRTSSKAAAVIGLVLFACSDSLIYYSADLKQYECDVVAALILFVLAIPAATMTVRRFLIVLLVGAGLIWFSHASLFVLGAILCVRSVEFLRDGHWRNWRVMGLALFLSVGALTAFYVFSYRNLGIVASAATSTPSASRSTFVSTAKAVSYGAGVPSGSTFKFVAPVALALAVIGFGSLLLRRHSIALMLGLSILFMFVAVSIGRYPSFGRTVLFAAPVVILFIAAGTVEVSRRFHPLALRVAVAAVLVAAVGWSSVAGAATHLSHARKQEEIKPVLRVLVQKWRSGDSLYVHYAAQYAFRYYAECRCFESDHGLTQPPLSFATRYLAGPNEWDSALASVPPYLYVGMHYPGEEFSDYLREVDRLPGRRRVWILTSHWSTEAERKFLTTTLPRHLNRIGQRKAIFRARRAQLFLYDLSG